MLMKKPNFPVIDPKPGFIKTVANFNQDDYVRIGLPRVSLCGGFLVGLHGIFIQAQGVYEQL
ncbi:hypothetical protein ACJIZ3_015264 [Penstemon smallii]|uniref:NADH-ubiquinone oxidoreductase 21kDa subunit N-terminal domain-containing protein n=1 Tax=Penstemon smallii TaxID=265156 RepID=A0ABD3RQ21_9LAMI